MDQNQTTNQAPAQPPTAPIEVPNKKTNFTTIIFTILIVVSFGLIALLFFQNQKLQKQISNQQVVPTIQSPTQTAKKISSISTTPDETAGWKTYTNIILGLSFKYPNEYKTPTESSNYISLISPLNPEPKKGYELQNGELKVEVYVFEATPNETLSDLVEKKKEKSEKIIKEESILVNGIKAVKKTWEGMGTGQTILLISNHKEYEIIKYPAVTTRDNEFDQILSTFKFIEDKTVNKVCGGIIGTDCPAGYVCSLDGSYPDSSGTCVLQANDK